jgi:hypothetical protein
MWEFYWLIKHLNSDVIFHLTHQIWQIYYIPPRLSQPPGVCLITSPFQTINQCSPCKLYKLMKRAKICIYSCITFYISPRKEVLTCSSSCALSPDKYLLYKAWTTEQPLKPYPSSRVSFKLRYIIKASVTSNYLQLCVFSFKLSIFSRIFLKDGSTHSPSIQPSGEET